MRKIPRRGEEAQPQGGHDTKDIPDIQLPQGYDDKLALLQPYVEKNHDLIARPFYLDNEIKLQACAFYFNAVVDDKKLNEHIFKPLMMHSGGWELDKFNNTDRVDLIVWTSISEGQLRKTDNLAEMVHSIFDGMVVLIFESIREAVIIDIHGGQLRAITEPPSEKATHGPREGFIENLDINIGMVRRHLRNPRLVIKKTMVGRRTRTPVAVLYIDDIVDHGLVEQVNDRLNHIDIDGVFNAGMIIQNIEDKPFSPFPQVWTSERPDKTIAELLEGRIAIMVDGTPTAIFLPALFIEFFQAPEDYLDRTYISSFLRYIRFLAYFIAISLPALYIALISFTPELLPVNLVTSLAQARKEVPFPVLIEVLIQEFIIQKVIESGLRLPGPVGQTAGVVAGIILGQAAISAKLATPAVIIIIAVTTISTFALPAGPLVQSTRILRLPMIFITAIFGLFGFSLGWIFMLAHLCSLESLGVPYFAPLAPMRFADLKDSLFRIWLWKMNLRPLSIPSQQKQRQGRTGKEGGEGE
ncbi:MAG: spore germination protein [Syntrophomonadaceae bacterium]|nr:spore germination protein [Syntrophomonadaceae bacterium]